MVDNRLQAALAIVVHWLAEANVMDQFVKTMSEEEAMLFISVTMDTLKMSESDIQDVIRQGIDQAREAMSNV